MQPTSRCMALCAHGSSVWNSLRILFARVITVAVRFVVCSLMNCVVPMGAPEAMVPFRVMLRLASEGCVIVSGSGADVGMSTKLLVAFRKIPIGLQSRS